MQAKALVPFRRPEGLSDLQMAEVFAQSGFFQDSKQAAQALTKILAGRELGIPPISAMTSIFIVKGRITIGANLIAALVKRSPKYDYKVVRLDAEGCTLTFTEGGQPLGESTFTMDDAKAANLKGENWTNYPRNMLFARAVSNGAKWFCPDLFGGAPVYTPEELGAALDGESGAPLVDLRTGEVVAEPAPERPPAVIKALAAWAEAGLRAQADGIEPAVRDIDTAPLEELRESTIRLSRLRAAAEEAGWPSIVHEAYELGLDPPLLSEMTTRRQLGETVYAWSAAVSARREERAEAGEEGPAPEALKPAADDDEEDIPVPF